MRLWEDGFDHYGSTASFMLDNEYAQNAAGIQLSTAHFVTGTHSLYFSGSSGGLGGFQGLRKVLPTNTQKLGAAARFYFPTLPNQPYANCIFGFLNSTLSNFQLAFFLDTNGAIRIVRGGQTNATNGTSLFGTLVATTDPIIGAASFNHIEVQAYIHPTDGWVRIAVNGIHKFQATGLNTQYDTSYVLSVGQYKSYNNDSSSFYMDDYYIYDFTGTSSVDTDFCPDTDGTGLATNYIGELQVWPLFANADTTQANWQKSTGTVGYTLINETPPDDAGYIYSTTGGDLSEFDLDDLPAQITYIRGLSIHARMSKSDAGAAMLQLGMKSGSSTYDAGDRPVTTAPTYWRDMANVDPASSARWTRASLNAGKLRLTRSI